MSFFEQIDPVVGSADAFPGGLGAGANLRTPCGPRRVENVRPGDMIVTRGNGLQPVRLVWRRTLTPEAVRATPALAPVRLTPRALGPMMPQHPLLLAPDHRMLIPGWRLADWPEDMPALVAAAEFAGVSDAAYIDRAGDGMTFYQFVFDFPQVLTVNGLPVESLVPDQQVIATLGLAERESLWQRFPQLKRDPSAYPPVEYRAAAEVEFRPIQP
ncbi:Hint domain-containing protein [Rhodovulum sp. ES.010]|uniref:Hint domain-containing protein n=1 Tax=Rhodovulum sp. ES.010 TaxID=1882821 RepID=UPI0009291CBB|nr:Hint domain-containing protein [Rhodovulum sp. ES.010]SIO39933.1 Hint domain-containing protein [Rhodovulum sp. ES.010]